MTDMIVIRSPRAMTDPKPGTQNVMYSDPRILISLRAEDAVSYGESEPVESLIARGAATLEERTFTRSGQWLAPLFSAHGANGKPSLVFDKNHQIANRTLNNTFANARPQPLTYIVVCRVTDYSDQNSRARIIGGSSTMTANMVPNNTAFNNEHISYSAGVGEIRAIREGTDWAVHIMVANGVNSLLKAGQRAIETLDLGTSGNNAMHLGGNIADISDQTGLKGEIAEVNMIGGALTVPEVLAWHSFLSEKYAITV